MEKLTDEALMGQVSQGDLDQMTPLFERYHLWIYNFFFQMVQDDMVSEDLTQNTFYKAIKYKHSYKGGKFVSWIFQIARNNGADYFKSLKAKKRLEDEMHIEQLSEEQASLDPESENVRRLQIVMKQLPEKDRELLIMNRFQGMKYKEIAKQVGSTEIAVKTKMHRVMNKLKSLYFEIETS